MTRKLEEILNLPENRTIVNTDKVASKPSSIEILDMIDESAPTFELTDLTEVKTVPRIDMDFTTNKRNNKDFKEDAETISLEVSEVIEQNKPFLREVAEYDKISAAMPQVTGLGAASDAEFDDLAARATAAYDDLMDLGMNVEQRFSGRIFEVAASMLKNAIDAKTAKIDKKLKILELQLRKAKMDKAAIMPEENEGVNLKGEGYIIADRNSLIDRLKNLNSE